MYMICANTEPQDDGVGLSLFPSSSGSLSSGPRGSMGQASRHKYILLHLSAALILADACFLLNAVVVGTGLDHRVVCRAVAVATHYTLLAALAWMAVEAFNMYSALVLVFDRRVAHLAPKMCLFGWGRITVYCRETPEKVVVFR